MALDLFLICLSVSLPLQSRIPNLQEQMKAKTIDCERFSNYLVSLREHKKTHDLKMQEIDLHLGQMGKKDISHLPSRNYAVTVKVAVLG